jgi:hypothetical protein
MAEIFPPMEPTGAATAGAPEFYFSLGLHNEENAAAMVAPLIGCQVIGMEATGLPLSLRSTVNTILTGLSQPNITDEYHDSLLRRAKLSPDSFASHAVRAIRRALRETGERTPYISTMDTGPGDQAWDSLLNLKQREDELDAGAASEPSEQLFGRVMRCLDAEADSCHDRENLVVGQLAGLGSAQGSFYTDVQLGYMGGGAHYRIQAQVGKLGFATQGSYSGLQSAHPTLKALEQVRNSEPVDESLVQRYVLEKTFEAIGKASTPMTQAERDLCFEVVYNVEAGQVTDMLQAIDAAKFEATDPAQLSEKVQGILTTHALGWRLAQIMNAVPLLLGATAASKPGDALNPEQA